MKRIYQATLVMLVGSFLLAACSGAKKLERSAIKGNWIVSSTSIEGVDAGTRLRTTVFDDVPVECFNGSTWSFPNNGYGSYNINSGAGCMGGERQIIWSVRSSNGMDYLNFKKMDGLKKNQAKNVEEGYSMELSSVTSNSFTARSPINFEGRTIYIVYNFTKQ